MKRDEAAPSLIPLLRWPMIHDAEVLAIVLHGWPRLTQPERLQAIEALFGRHALVDVAEPREQVMEVLRRAVTDPSAAVRDRTLRGINGLPELWAGKGSTKLLLSALADDEPALRRRGLTLASTKAGFWSRPDTLEYLKRLLVDPDAQVRRLALVDRRTARADSCRAGAGSAGEGPGRRPGSGKVAHRHPHRPGRRSRHGRTRRSPQPASSLELFDLSAQGQPGLLSSR